VAIMQLIRIVYVPIEYKMEIENARLEYDKAAQQPSANVHRVDATLRMDHNNAQMHVDTTDTRAQLGMKSMPRYLRDKAASATQKTNETIASIVETGNMMTQPNTTISDIAAQKLMESPVSDIGASFTPTTGPAVTWQPSTLQVDYTPGSLTFDWNVLQGTMKYIPGKVNIEILRDPDVQIEYIGGPNYVPPSADPNYRKG
ncbi:MAG: DUF6470 family protein, partial [Oscillospiraceae bacterium]